MSSDSVEVHFDDIDQHQSQPSTTDERVNQGQEGLSALESFKITEHNDTAVEVELSVSDPGASVFAKTGVSPFGTQKEAAEALDATDEEGRSLMENPAYRAFVEARLAASVGTEGPYNEIVWDEGAAGRHKVQSRKGQEAGASIDLSEPLPSPAKGFRSMDAIERAQTDPRYQNNPNFRRYVDQKIGLTPNNVFTI